jgi:serine protease
MRSPNQNPSQNPSQPHPPRGKARSFKRALQALRALGAVSALMAGGGLLCSASATGTALSQRPAQVASSERLVLELRPPVRAAAAQAQELRLQRTVEKPGAEYIKVHFSEFQLPAGAYLLVASADGREVYRYDASHEGGSAPRTFDPATGEDGRSRFSAMSVFGDKAVLTLVVPAGVHWEPQHGVKVERFHAGYGVADFARRVSPLSVCGTDERRDAVCFATSHPTPFDRSRPVARLIMGGSGLCTGWRVGASNHLFTNNHCFSTQATLTNTEVWFNYQNTTCGGSTLGNVVKVTGGSLLKTDAALDYSLFTVNNFASIASFGHFGLDPREPVLGEQIYIPGHGEGKPKQIALNSDKNSGGLCQIDNASRQGTGSATDTDVGYYCDTMGGNSGSPVVAARNQNVIALHHLGGCMNSGAKISKIWPQVASFFNNQVPVGDNSGTANKPPVAQFTSNCQGLSCSFSGAASSDPDGSIASYAWAFGDGKSGSGVSASNAYGTAGSYTVTLTVTDNQGAKGSTTQAVAVSAAAAIELTSGVARTNQQAGAGQALNYFIKTTQPNTQVTVSSSGGTGNADLYVRSGAEPTGTQYDCRPALAGNAESCTVLLANPGTVYARLLATSAFSGVSVLATAQPGGTGFPKTGLAANTGEWLRYFLVVPAGKTSVTVTTSGGSGDADLYVRRNEQPSSTLYNCRSQGATNVEKCTISVAAGDTVHIGLYAYSKFSNVTLDAK